MRRLAGSHVDGGAGLVRLVREVHDGPAERLPCSAAPWSHVEVANDPLARARSALAAAERWLAGLADAWPPTPEGARAFLDAPPAARGLAAELAARACMAAVLRIDAPAREAAAELARRLATDGEASAAEPWAELAQTWQALGSADALDDAALAELERRARERRLADLVIDAASLRALALAEHDALEPALANARRASRMARTERLPQTEYLAGLTLARLRRLGGRPYLATRIASALRRFAPRPWHAWIDWELVLASGRGASSSATTGPAEHLQVLLEHASAGDRASFDAAASRAWAATEGFAPFRHDLRRVLVAVDPAQDPASAPPRLARWLDGLEGFSSPPFGLARLEGRDEGARSASAVAMVLARPQAPGRRVLRVGRGLALQLTQGRCLDDPSPGRPEAVLCALALAGPRGVEDGALFQSVYGFEYVPALHRGTFDVALHRARARLSELGEIERAEGRMRLHVWAAFVVVDPRSLAELDDRVLALVARSGAISAREAAQSLGIPLRTVQGSLRDLVDGGACLQQRAGRGVVYAVEDTTFQEPTLTRDPA